MQLGREGQASSYLQHDADWVAKKAEVEAAITAAYAGGATEQHRAAVIDRVREMEELLLLREGKATREQYEQQLTEMVAAVRADPTAIAEWLPKVHACYLSVPADERGSEAEKLNALLYRLGPEVSMLLLQHMQGGARNWGQLLLAVKECRPHLAQLGPKGLAAGGQALRWLAAATEGCTVTGW
jgi:hypothetical protein